MAGVTPWTMGAALLGLSLAVPRPAVAADEVPPEIEQAWEAARNPAHPGWVTAPLPGNETPAVSEAIALEQAFDLDGALTAFDAVCAGLPTDWASWISACEGAARTAYALDDEGALDRALGSLLARRPDHELEQSRFPPDLHSRAETVADQLPTASLEVADSLAEVSLDGLLLGVAPLRLPRLPAGEHRLTCNGWSHTFRAAEGDVVALACPAPAVLDHPLPYLLASQGGDPTLAEVTTGVGGMDPGTWVFYGAEEGSAVLVHEPASGPGPWFQAVRRVRAPAN